METSASGSWARVCPCVTCCLTSAQLYMKETLLASAVTVPTSNYTVPLETQWPPYLDMLGTLALCGVLASFRRTPWSSDLRPWLITDFRKILGNH